MRSNFRVSSAHFSPGLAVNASAREAPASAKLQFLGKSLFIPIFFVVTGFLIDPVKFVYGIFDDFLLVSSIVGSLLAGKWVAAWLVGRANGYNLNEQLTIWSLTLPQVAATLAATLVAHRDVQRGRSAAAGRSDAQCRACTGIYNITARSGFDRTVCIAHGAAAD